MDSILFGAGIALIVIVFLEMLWTTMGIGSGYITRYVSGTVWWILIGLHRIRRSHLLLTWGGIAILLLVFSIWVLFLWAGWSLVFLSFEDPIVYAYDERQITFWDQIYFTGFTISTLGVGDFAPSGSTVQVLTAAASISGLFLVTFSVTYLVPIAQAVTQARQTAVHISCLGLSPDDLLLHMCSDSGCQHLEDQLRQILPRLVALEQQHLTYPILHYFHIPMRPEAVVLSVAVLDEALSIITCGIDTDDQIDSQVLRIARQVITEFLQTLSGSFVTSGEDTPPVPSLDRIREEGLHVVDDETFEHRMSKLSRRRQILLGLVENEGWRWDAVYDRTTDTEGLIPLNRVESSLTATKEVR